MSIKTEHIFIKNMEKIHILNKMQEKIIFYMKKYVNPDKIFVL